ncbi:MAG TPA: M23 family metallopeptidase [Candidatus Limnocylindria bacterium]|nr:M23 family metallopeptidase [Candidatus Limnocylindria bacterium]
MRVAVAILVIAASAVAAFALAPAPRDTPAPVTTPTAAPFVTADPSVTARADPVAVGGRSGEDDRAVRRAVRVRGLLLPVDGVELPTDDELLPNAERAYRGGWHEGIDFPAPAGTPVRAVARGVVVRIDREFTDWPAESERAALAEATRLGYTPDVTLDLIRGRQVWIDHGGGIVSRYAHLDTVADLAVGARVERGTIVGTVGSSGYPEGGPHLHLEIRTGTSYLGDGLTGDALRAAVAAAFG